METYRQMTFAVNYTGKAPVKLKAEKNSDLNGSNPQFAYLQFDFYC